MNLNPQQIRMASWAAIAVVTWLLLSLLAPVLMPFLLAAVLAYALHPLVERLHASRVPRWLGAGLPSLRCVDITLTWLNIRGWWLLCPHLPPAQDLSEAAKRLP